MRAGRSPGTYAVIQLIYTIEYVAPLGSTSLIFNFLFARFLIGTPVTMTDVYVRYNTKPKFLR